jgi:hypothetical protein
MSRKALLTYRKVSDNTVKLRLLIVNGIVVNPEVEAEIRENDFEAIALRRTGEKVRNLVHVVE